MERVCFVCRHPTGIKDKIHLMTQEKPVIRIRGREHTLRAGMPLRKAMKILNITPGTYLIIRAGELITEDEVLQPGDVIELAPVISGG